MSHKVRFFSHADVKNVCPHVDLLHIVNTVLLCRKKQGLRLRGMATQQRKVESSSANDRQQEDRILHFTLRILGAYSPQF